MQLSRLTICALALAGLAPAGLAADDHVIRYTPQLRAEELRGRPDSDIVLLPNGRQMRLGDLRRVTALAGRLRAAPVKPLPPALTIRPAPRGLRVNDANELAAALALPESDTLELPSGRRLTVAQLKFLQPQIEKQLGRPLAAATPGRTAMKVGARPDWKRILQMPDDTLLEAPDGTRVTVADLKRALREDAAPRATARPAGAP